MGCGDGADLPERVRDSGLLVEGELRVSQPWRCVRPKRQRKRRRPSSKHVIAVTKEMMGLLPCAARTFDSGPEFI